MFKLITLTFALLMAFTFNNLKGAAPEILSSPDGQLRMTLELSEDGRMYYSLNRNGQSLLGRSALGLLLKEEDFSSGMRLLRCQRGTTSDRYTLFAGKSSNVTYYAKTMQVFLENAKGKPLQLMFNLSDDGLAFRYLLPGENGSTYHLERELSAFNLGEDARAWLQPMSVAKTGWEQSNPSYEEYYHKDIKAGAAAPTAAGWVFPALFRRGDNWLLISETAADNDYCGTRLAATAPEGVYSIDMPDKREGIAGKAVLPEFSAPWHSPWRLVAAGSLRTIVESTLGTDLAKPAAKGDWAWVKPGLASWSWVLYKDDSTVYRVQKRFIDYAADMHWQYCLIDADWDRKIGMDSIAQLASYASKKGVGLLLWYNSAGAWNTTPYTPRNKLLTAEDRRREFAALQKLGIRGIKVDFFGGDGQSMMSYYQDILRDAASHQLMVNFHGATLPRGLQRTFPNLLTVEAIKGMEFATFEQRNEDEQPAHCATIPFIRNVFDPMDYTPMVFGKIPKIKRATRNSFELALPLLFQSGIQHIAENPEGIAAAPEYVRAFLRQLPAHWDETRFVDGYPGRYVVLARRSGKRWMLAAINGQQETQTLQLDLSFMGKKELELIESGTEYDFARQKLSNTKVVSMSLPAAAGAVIW